MFQWMWLALGGNSRVNVEDSARGKTGRSKLKGDGNRTVNRNYTDRDQFENIRMRLFSSFSFIMNFRSIADSSISSS